MKFKVDNLLEDSEKPLYSYAMARKPSYTYAYHRDTEALQALHPLLKKSQLGVFTTILDDEREKFDQSKAVRYHDIAQALSAQDLLTKHIKTLALKLSPWRKGPFYKDENLIIDSEWDSIQKWHRLQLTLDDLKNKVVLDVGSNSGYYAFKALELDPKLVIGLDPTLLYYFQFQALRDLLLPEASRQACHMFSTGFEAMKAIHDVFDTVFCLGILYHHKLPLDMLRLLNQAGKKRHVLYVETLYYDTQDHMCLTPHQGIYAGMPNVWYIPSIPVLTDWLKTAGYPRITVLDESVTKESEQRHRPEWAGDYSGISTALDSSNPNLTIEGYPRPRRVLLKAETA